MLLQDSPVPSWSRESDQLQIESKMVYSYIDNDKNKTKKLEYIRKKGDNRTYYG